MKKIKISILYDEKENKNIENVFNIETDNVIDILNLCVSFKNQYNITPFGFILMKYEIIDGEITICEVKNYFFNGLLVPIENLPISVYSSLKEPCKYFIYLNDDFFIPFNIDKDINLNINIWFFKDFML